MLNSVGKIAKPVAIATDVVHQDDGTIGKNTMLTSASVAGGWAGAAIGGIIGSLFAGVGAVPGTAIGGFVGGIVGGIIGSFGRSWLAEEGANHFIK